ncbi:prolipoprotein diacylglyceryl transferase [uncultured Litoreibacter sp.]|uniref:prolipoprotein diacylglyceryl transferase n=1 Tax=uncultured Litoreibacter sp. TaxID=1392394 RepID=UPI00262EFB29|nr:prolipoprotein diacylglyceryl transferase [uncultured Litoreibacter sp.]
MLAALLPFPDIGPDIFTLELFGREFSLRWYAMAYIVGIIIGWFIAVQLFKRARLWPENKSPMTSENASDLVTWIILGVVLGGRFGFVLFYQPAYYFANPGEILQIWNGGMSFHGGALGVLIAGLIFCWKNKFSPLSVGDAIVVATPPAIFLGRIANFINAELWGRPTDLPWAVVFPGDAAQACATVEQMCARHPSQLYEALLEGLILCAVLFYLAIRKGWLKTPGALIGAFLAGYGIARFIVEFVRQPDAQFTSATNPLGYAWQIGEVGLTMGQLLSTPMIIVGLLIIWGARRRAA